jgi:hypothetical protein
VIDRHDSVFSTGCLFSKVNGLGLAAPWPAVSTYSHKAAYYTCKRTCPRWTTKWPLVPFIFNGALQIARSIRSRIAASRLSSYARSLATRVHTNFDDPCTRREDGIFLWEDGRTG